jgi:amino acid transporter
MLPFLCSGNGYLDPDIFSICWWLLPVRQYSTFIEPVQVRFADRFVDEALGVCSGLNLFFAIGTGIPYEITAFNLMLNFWTDKIPVISVIVFMILCYG